MSSPTSSAISGPGLPRKRQSVRMTYVGYALAWSWSCWFSDWFPSHRYRLLADPASKLRFVDEIQKPLLKSFCQELFQRASTCNISNIFRGSLRTGCNSGASTDHRWRDYCAVLESFQCVTCVLQVKPHRVRLSKNAYGRLEPSCCTPSAYSRTFPVI